MASGSPESYFLVAENKPANSRQGAEYQLETASSDEILKANSVAAEPLQHRNSVYSIQTNQQTPHWTGSRRLKMKSFSRTTYSRGRIGTGLIGLREESMHCLPCSEFYFIYEYPSPALTVVLRTLSRDDQSEVENLKQIVSGSSSSICSYIFVASHARASLSSCFLVKIQWYLSRDTN
jgi:hypothetical protein